MKRTCVFLSIALALLCWDGASALASDKFRDSYTSFLRVLEERHGSTEMIRGVGLYAAGELTLKILNKAQAPAYGDSPYSFELDNYSAGFEVLRRFQFDLAIGPGSVFEDLPLYIPEPFVALLPEIGGSVTYQQYISKKEEIPRKPLKVRPHRETSRIDAWSVGDRLIFDAVGGVAFSAGLGTSAVASGGFRYLATGAWIVEIEKFGESAVYLKLTKRKLHSLFERVAFFGLQAARRDFAQVDRFFSFAFDLSAPEARAAFERASYGDLTLAEELADSGREIVRRVFAGEGDRRGGATSFSAGVFLLASWTWTSNQEAFSSMSFFDNRTQQTLHYGFYRRELERRGFLFDFYRKRTEFIASNTAGSEYAGQVQWQYEREGALTKDVNAALLEIGKRLGIEVDFRVADSAEDLGYLVARLNMEISQAGTNHLIWMFVEEKGRSLLVAQAQKLVDRYFTSGDDITALCGSGEASNAEAGVTQDPQEILRECRARLLHEATQALKNMAQQARAMAATRGSDSKAFVAAYAKFGRYFLKNRFAFRAVLAELEDFTSGLTVSFEGERISKLTRPL